MIARHVNGKIEETKNAFIEKSTAATTNYRTDSSSHSSPNSIKSTNGEKVVFLLMVKLY